MNRYLRYALLALLWGAVAAYILYAGSTAQRLRAARTVGKVEIEVVDSSSMGYLVSGRMVRGWIAHSGIKTKGTAVDKVPLTQIEEMIARNGFVERVDAYVTYDGVLHVDISQRRPLVRLLVDGAEVPSEAISKRELDISAYLEKDEDGKITRSAWHTVELVPDKLTRIEANLFAQTFIQSTGGGDY